MKTTNKQTDQTINKSHLRLSWVAFLLALILPGCGPHKSAETQNKIVVWHWMSDRQNAFDELAKRYKQEKGIDVVFELYAPSDAYAQKVRAGAQSNTLPEVYGILAESRDFASFIKSGHVANLNDQMNADNAKWKNSFYPKALANNTFSTQNAFGVVPGIYGVPLDVMNIQMLYNKKLFAKAGLNPEKPPLTWKDFLVAAKALNKANIPVFVSGWGELWMIDCFASSYALHFMGEQKFLDTFRGKVSYTDPDWVKVLEIFNDFRKEKILINGGVSMVNKTSEQTFANERAAITLNGSWCVNVYAGMNPKLEYGTMLPPKVNPKDEIKIWGGAGSSFVINQRSTNKDKAIAFMQWMSDKDQQVYLSETTKNLPANRYASSNIPPIMASFSTAMDFTTHPSQWDVRENPVVAEAFTKGIQSILIGEKTPEQVAEEVQKLKDQNLAASAK